MKITQYDDLYTQKLGAGETTLVSGSSGGSNSAFGGDVVGSAGSLSVVGLRQTVSLSSNIAPSAAVGNVLTLISVGGTPVAQFAVSSNSGSASFGSNATRVSASSFVGASTNSAREDHRHDGIGTVTASSSNTLDRGTLNLRAGSGVAFALTDSDGSGGFDTVTVSSTAPGAGGSSSTLYRDTTTRTLTNTVTETDVFPAQSISAGALGTTGSIRAQILCNFNHGVVGTVTIRVYYDSTVIASAACDAGAIAASKNATVRALVQNLASASSQRGMVDVLGQDGSGGGGSTAAWVRVGTGTGAVNTSSAFNFKITAQWGAASASNILTSWAVLVEVLPS